MSKTMGFRNLGKFDFSGKSGKFVIIGGVVIVVILSVLVVGGEVCSDRGSPLKGPNKFFVKCTECGEEWEIERKELANFQDRDLRDEQGNQIRWGLPALQGRRVRLCHDPVSQPRLWKILPVEADYRSQGSRLR